MNHVNCQQSSSLQTEFCVPVENRLKRRRKNTFFQILHKGIVSFFFSRQVSACDLITSQRPRLVILTPFNYVPTHEHWLTREPHSNTNNTLWEGIANDNSLMNILVKNMGVGAKRVKHIQRNLTSTTLQAILPKQVRKVERIMAS